MNTERTSSSAPRPSVKVLQADLLRAIGKTPSSFRLFFVWIAAALVLAGLAATASQAGLNPASKTGLGSVLALASQLRTARLHAAAASSHTPGGRTVLPRRMMHAGALVARAAAAAGVVPISGGVQTYDISNPPPAFRPLVGYGSLTALNNNSTNPPVLISSLIPTNLTPVWSADETFIVFSSNRTQTGGVNTDGVNTDGSAGSRYHLWAVSVNGGEAFQITTSTGPASIPGALAGELFPALSRTNLAVAFTSDAATPGTQNLYVLPFSYSNLSSGSAATDLSATTANPTPPASLTVRASTEAASAALTGFSRVLRPTFSPNDDQLIVFSALSVVPTLYTDPFAGHDHIYFLYTSSGGFSQGNNVSYPGKLTDGPADDTDPTFAPDGTYIAFASTANAGGFTRNPNNTFGPPTPSDPQDPNNSQSLSGGAVGTRSVFLISGGLSSTGVAFGTVPTALGTGGRISLGSTAGLDDYGPAWSSFANQNQYTNPAGQLAYLAFARSTEATISANVPHDIRYFQAAKGVASPSTETLVKETAAGGANVAVKLNSDDNSGEATQSGAGAGTNAGNSFDDIYPTWSPFLSIFSIAYMSNRTVTYNNPVNGSPVEIAASVTPGGTVTNSNDTTQNYTVGGSYEGLLVSQVLNLDPPTLLRFSAGEVVHVQAGNVGHPVIGTPNKLAATGGQPVTLTVRLSDREAGIDNTHGLGGGPRVYVQIKDPDSKYQDSRNAEHKVSAKDPQYNGQSNQPLSDVTSGTVNNFIGNGFPFYGSINTTPVNKYTYPSYGTPDQTTPGIATRVNPRGAHGGHWFAPDANDPESTYIFVGKGAIGTINTATVTNPGTGSGPPVTSILPGTDPTQFIPQGPEYEAQVVNPQFAVAGTGDTHQDVDQTITVAYPAGYTTVAPTVANPTGRISNVTGSIGDYVSPYWLAGVDDQNAFSGGTYGVNGTDRPTAGYTTSGTAADGTATTTTHPAEWLQLTRVPTDASGKQDGDANGGVLYSVTWNTPSGGSDFYVDVVAYDNAVFPNFPVGTSIYQGNKTNWRIYDNVGGFSTNSSIGGNDILVVSDYALGQKFAATTFGGRNTNLNLVPKIFGTESYLTDVDVNILPDSVYAGIPTSPASYIFQPAIQTFFFPSESNVLAGNFPGGQNGLGVGSYIDNTINDGTTVNNPVTGTLFPNVQSQRYSIWRILTRGPVPASLLQIYAPTPVMQPAIADAADPTYAHLPATSVMDAPRCVVWLSPYTGDVLADPGTIDDPGNIGVNGVTQPRASTTSLLTSFVKSGGRLFITGQDVGSTLTQGGTVGNTPSTVAGSPNFLPDVLNAELAANTSGTNILAATSNRITGSPFYDSTSVIGNGNYNTLTGPIQGPIFEVFPNLPYQDNLVLGDADFSDSGLSQIPAISLPGGASIQGQPDVITAVNGATTAMTYGAAGGGALVYHDDPYLGGTAGLAVGITPGQLPNGGTGSRVVYAGLGIEGLSQDYYASASPNPSMMPAYDEIIPAVMARNPRTEILHNIVNYLRTGRVNGTITQTAGTGQGAGQPISGVTVYLHPLAGSVPSTRAAFSALTDSGGVFSIAGVEPGTYTLVAVKPGFQRATSNAGVRFTVEGDVTKTNATLTMTPQNPGNIAGTVHDTTNNPVSGATVTFTSQDNSVTKTAVTVNGSVPGNAAENYFIQNVPVTNYTAIVTSPLNPQNNAPEYTVPAPNTPDAPYNAGVIVQPNTTTQPVNFTLTPVPATITGTVTSTAAGSPLVPGATVTLYDSTNTTPVAGVAAAVTGANGSYTLVGIPAAASPTATSYFLRVTAPGFAPGGSASGPLFLGSTLTEAAIPIMPIPPGSISGTVTYTTGGPVPGAIVTYTAPGGNPQTITAAADGTYTIANVPPAIYAVTAIGPNNANGKPTTQAAATQQVTVTSSTTATANFSVVPIPPSFSGTVVSAATSTTPSAPLANATVSVIGTDTNGNPVNVSVKTSAAGTYTTPALAPGTYTVTASLPGYANSSNPVVTVQLGDVITGDNFTLTAVAPGSITGSVKDSAGNPVVGATVTYTSSDGSVTLPAVTTDASGNYLIPPPPAAATVPASSYLGNAVGPNNENNLPQYGADPAAPITVVVPAGGSGVGNFTLPAIPATVSGVITDAQTLGNVAGATVTLTGPTGTAAIAPVTTGANGAFTFSGILPPQSLSSYTLTVSAPNYAPGTSTFALSLGDTLTESLALNEQATLYGLVSDGSPDGTGQPIPGVTLTVKDAGGNIITTVPAPLITQAGTTTGPDGQPINYLATLLPGTYTITASKGGFDSQTSAAFTLTNTAPVRVPTFALRSSIGNIGGLVTDQNGAGLVSGATVTVIPAGQTTGLSFTTTGTESNGPDGSPLNYTGQLSEGKYTVTVSKGGRTSVSQPLTVVGGTFNRLDFSAALGLPSLHTFAKGIQFVSTPYDYSAIGFNGLFGMLNTALAGTTPNGNRSVVAVWNPLIGAYALEPNAPADIPRLGVGYWVFLLNPTSVTQQGAGANGNYVPVSLGQGWNQIGVPNPSAAGIPVQSLMFDNGNGGMITFQQASSSQYNLIKYPLYSYAGGTTYEQVGSGGTLMPWAAYWIYVSASATLEIPTH